MFQMIKNFFKEEEGATAVEYGIMVAAIAAIIVGIVYTLGGNVNTAFSEVNSAIESGAGS